MEARVKREPLELDQDQEQGNVTMENSRGHCVLANVGGGERRKVAIGEDDPLLQETINALMSGAGAIEVVTGAPVGGATYHLNGDERPFKCGSCEKTFREQYRLTKHQRTHQQQPDQETEHSQDSSFPSSAGQTTADDEDYATGDSERFFKSYELQEGTAALKLEPDISLTVDGTNPTTAASGTATQSSTSEHDTRYQIIEERIKSLQREVHLVNSNLSRVESKLDGLTKIIAIFINKFDEVDGQTTTNTSVAINPPASSSTMIPLVSIPVEALPAAPQPPPPPPPPPSTPSVAPQTIQMITHHQVPVQVPVAVPQQQQQPQPTTTFVTCHGGGGHNINNDTFPEVPELPIRTVSDFLDLNDHCTDNDQFLLQMVSCRVATKSQKSQQSNQTFLV